MNKATASVDAIVQEIVIEASAERIFDAITKPEELLKWWAAEGKFQAVQVEADLRPGGKWKMRVLSCGGTESTVGGMYRKIERPHLLVFTWIREEEGRMETEVRWDVEERDGVTKVRVTHSGLSTEHLRARNSGWHLILSLLQEHTEDRMSAISRKPLIGP